MEICNFCYDGVFGRELAGKATYTVEFIEWTDDPGMFMGQCSDGKTRAIPSWAIVGKSELPPQHSIKRKVKAQMKRTGLPVHIGVPSSSK